MNIAALTSQSSPGLQAALQDRYQDFNQLQTALQSGNIANAQRAFAAFQQDAQKTAQLAGSNSLFAVGSPAVKDLQALGAALRSADLSGAQKAFMSLTQDISNAGRSAQVVDNVSLHHPTTISLANKSAATFTTNSGANATAQAAGSVLNEQA